LQCERTKRAVVSLLGLVAAAACSCCIQIGWDLTANHSSRHVGGEIEGSTGSGHTHADGPATIGKILPDDSAEINVRAGDATVLINIGTGIVSGWRSDCSRAGGIVSAGVGVDVACLDADTPEGKLPPTAVANDGSLGLDLGIEGSGGGEASRTGSGLRCGDVTEHVHDSEHLSTVHVDVGLEPAAINDTVAVNNGAPKGLEIASNGEDVDTDGVGTADASLVGSLHLELRGVSVVVPWTTNQRHGGRRGQ